ncbi:MAG TPA: hypothetical protein VK601_16290, partial [Kofleriaceae bacterium]|nr:hypothetical protein [Kofleriaceae bacterium]
LVIQELLGHSSIATTMIYAHLAPHVARDAVRLLDRARASGRGSGPGPHPEARAEAVAEFCARVVVRSVDPRPAGEGSAKPARGACNQPRS